MLPDKLILRTLYSPYNDTTLGSVLSHDNLDNNFIYLKGLSIYTAFTQNNNLILSQKNGDNFSINLGDLVYTGITNNVVSGTGTTNNIPKWLNLSALTGSLINDDGTNVNIANSFTSRSNKTGSLYGSWDIGDGGSLLISAGFISQNYLTLRNVSSGVKNCYFYYDVNGEFRIRNNSTNSLIISSGGTITLPDLSGSNVRYVTANSGGTLSTTINPLSQDTMIIESVAEYILDESSANKMILVNDNDTASILITVPANSATTIPINYFYTFVQNSNAPIIFTSNDINVTINSIYGNATNVAISSEAKYGVSYLKKINTNEWLLWGSIAAL